MSTRVAHPAAPALRVATGAGVAAALWTAAILLVWSNVLDPLPDGSGWVSVTLFLTAAVAAGVALGSWWAVLLAVVPSIVANAVGYYHDLREPIPVAEWGIPLWAAFLAAGGLAGARCSPPVRRAVVVAVALATGALAVAAGVRTLWPADLGASPAPIEVDLAAGRAGIASLGTVTLGDGFGAAATRLQAGRYRQTGGQAFRNPAPGVDLPGQVLLEVPYSVARGPGITLIGRREAVTAILLTTGTAQTRSGIGVGDNLALVRHREAGARCDRDRQLDRPECVVTRGRHLAVFAGDPIEVIALVVAPDRERVMPTPGTP